MVMPLFNICAELCWEHRVLKTQKLKNKQAFLKVQHDGLRTRVYVRGVSLFLLIRSSLLFLGPIFGTRDWTQAMPGRKVNFKDNCRRTRNVVLSPNVSLKPGKWKIWI